MSGMGIELLPKRFRKGVENTGIILAPLHSRARHPPHEPPAATLETIRGPTVNLSCASVRELIDSAFQFSKD